jgi:hypothetical protein
VKYRDAAASGQFFFLILKLFLFYTKVKAYVQNLVKGIHTLLKTFVLC